MIRRYIITFVVFFLIDIIWLGFVAPKFYKAQIGHLMSSQPNWISAVIFYLIYIVALLIFVINPSVEKSSIKHALIYGGLLGFSMYATYDLTNLATLKHWPILVTVVDLVWGTFITAMTSIIASKFFIYFKL